MSEVARAEPLRSPEDSMARAMSVAKYLAPVFPVLLTPTVRSDGSEHVDKRPLIRWGEGATTDLEQIATWWSLGVTVRDTHYPGELLWPGYHTGRGGLVLVDLDVDKGHGAGRDNLKAAGLELPKSFRYRTLSGGEHRLFPAPAGLDLTIGQGGITPGLPYGVDVRAGVGYAVYYGPALTEAPALGEAPAWALIERSAEYDRGYGDIDRWLERTTPVPKGAKPSKAVRRAERAVTREGMGHHEMLTAVSDLVKLGTEPGAGQAFERARATYLTDYPEFDRHWDAAAAGSIAQHGLPPVTLPLTKAERRAIEVRNDPKAVEAADAQRKAEWRVSKIDERAELPADEPEVGRRELTDASLAEEVAANLVGVWASTEAAGLLRWTGKRWKPATETALIETVRKRLRVIRAEETKSAILRGDTKREQEARTIEARTKVVAITKFAAGILAERGDVPDAHPDLLNTPSGIVDLRTAALLPHDPSYMLTKITAVGYDPKAPMDDWETALEALPPKSRAWMQYRFGQAITGYMTDDDKLPLLRGSGDNGKSAIFNGVRTAVGDYCVTVGERLLLANPGDHPTELTVLMGARMAVIEELPEGRNLNVKRLKDVIGTPRMSARRMRADPVEWDATHSIFLSTNYTPIVAETDHGTWKRLALVRFPFTFKKAPEPLTSRHDRRADPGLRDRLGLVPSASALRWAVEGARLWYENDRQIPAPPKSVERDTLAWRHDADPVLSYIDERLELDEHSAITTNDLARDFNDYIDRRGHRPWSQQTVNSRFEGHKSMGDVKRKRAAFSAKLRASRPPMAIGPIPKNTQVWVGVRFVDDPGRIPSEAEMDAATLADLERRADTNG